MLRLQQFSALILRGTHGLTSKLHAECIDLAVVVCTMLLALPATTYAQNTVIIRPAPADNQQAEHTKQASLFRGNDQPVEYSAQDSELPPDFWHTPEEIQVTQQATATSAQTSRAGSELPPDFWHTPEEIQSIHYTDETESQISEVSTEFAVEDTVIGAAVIATPLMANNQMPEEAVIANEPLADVTDQAQQAEAAEQVETAEAPPVEPAAEIAATSPTATDTAAIATTTQIDASSADAVQPESDIAEAPRDNEVVETSDTAASQPAAAAEEPAISDSTATVAATAAAPIAVNSQRDAKTVDPGGSVAGGTEITRTFSVAEQPESGNYVLGEVQVAAATAPIVPGNQLDRDAWTGTAPPTDPAAPLERIILEDQANPPVIRENPSPGSTDQPPRGSSRILEAVEVSTPPVIDGKLDDFVWIENVPSSNFWVTQQQIWPDEQTEVRVLTDGQFIYFGLMMYDSQPEDILALEAVRDRGLGFDDQVSVQIISTGDFTDVSRFSVNARGTQSDRLAGGSAANISWKGDWDAAVKRTENGWSAELAIPFAMLKYTPDTSQFSINVVRYQNRTRQWSYWADTTPQDRPEEMGQLININPPANSIERRTWTIMPFALAGLNVVDREGELQEEMLTGGVDLRYTPNSDTTGVISLNPDFTQVEAQVASANFSYNEQEVAEARVFFQEGETYFGDDLRFFYSPRIPDFIGGGKIFGQASSFQYASFITQSPDSRTDALGRLSYAFTPTYSTSAIVNATDREEVEGSTVGISGSGRQEIGTFWDFDLGAVSNSDVKIYDEDTQFCGIGKTECDAFMIDGRAGWQGNYWSTGVSYDKYDKEFLPANGLIRTDRLGTSAWDVFLNHYHDYGNKTISETTFDIVRTLRKTEDGRDQYDGWFYGGSLEWYSFARTGLSYNQGDYRAVAEVDDEDDPNDGLPIVGEFGDTVTDDFFWTASLDLNTRGSRVNFYSAYSSGELAGGDYDYGYVYLFARPTYNTSISINVERTELAYPNFISVTDQIITDAGWDITSTDSITFRHIYFDLSEDLPQFPEFSTRTKEQYWRLGYRRVVSSGLDVFLLYDDQPFEEATYSIKLLWTIN